MENRISCPACSRKFLTTEARERHLERAHSDSHVAQGIAEGKWVQFDDRLETFTRVNAPPENIVHTGNRVEIETGAGRSVVELPSSHDNRTLDVSVDGQLVVLSLS